MALNFPYPATEGQIYLAPNGVTYVYQNGKWNLQPFSQTGNLVLSNNVITSNNLGNIYIDSNNFIWTFDDTGGLVFPDNTVQTTAGGGGNANTGNIRFNGDAIYDLNGIIIENADLTHAATAAITLPANSDTSDILLNKLYGGVTIGTGPANAIIYQWEFGSDGTFNLPASVNGNALIQSLSPIEILSSDKSWIFGTDGTLTLSGSENFGQQPSRLNPPQPYGTTDLLTLWNFGGTNPTGEYYNYAIGVEGDHIWFATDTNPANSDGGFKFYSRGQETLKIGSDGSFVKADGFTFNAGAHGSITLGTYIEVPGVDEHFHIAFPNSNAEIPYQDLYVGNDFNYVKIRGSHNNQTLGVDIGANQSGIGSGVWRFNPDGTTTFPDNTIKSTTSTNITIASSGLSWYNIFGELNNSESTQWTLDGSVTYDGSGNLYVLGSTTDSGDSFNGTNLFIKYSPQGELLWRKTWLDSTGDVCGSYNASMRFQPNSGGDTIDIIVWASNGQGNTPTPIGYIGTMDLDGNIVDPTGNPRNPLALPGYRITDLSYIPGPPLEIAYVSGSWYYADTNQNYAVIGGVDFNDPSDYVNYVFAPQDQDTNYSDNYFKSINVSSGGELPIIWATGAYHSSLYNGYTTKPIVGLLVVIPQNNPNPFLFHVGDPAYDSWFEDSGLDQAGNTYAIINAYGYNNATDVQYNNFMVVLSATANGFLSLFTIDRWQKKIERITGDLTTTFGLGLTNHGDYVYVAAYIGDNAGNSDLAILKLNAGTGDLVWARTIGSPSVDQPSNLYDGGYHSSSDISIDPTGTYLAFTAVTQDLHTGDQYTNNLTIQYPLDGSILGAYGDFTITDSTADFTVTDNDFTVEDITSTSIFDQAPEAISTETLIASSTTVGEGWTNHLQTLGNTDKTWTFNADGTLQLPSSNNPLYQTYNALIKSVSNIQISAGDDVGSNWVFSADGSVTFPDSTVQTTAYTGTTRWDAIPAVGGCPIYAELTPDHFQAFTQVTHLNLLNNGYWSVGSNFNGTGLYSIDNTSTTLFSNYGNVVIGTNDQSTEWTFGADGSLTLPDSTADGYGAYIWHNATDQLIIEVQPYTDNSGIYLHADTTGTSTFYGTGNVSIRSDNNANNSGVPKEWIFGVDGRTSFPNYTFEAPDGTPGQMLATNGSGSVTWTTPPGPNGNANTGDITFVGSTIASSTNADMVLHSNGFDLLFAATSNGAALVLPDSGGGYAQITGSTTDTGIDIYTNESGYSEVWLKPTSQGGNVWISTSGETYVWDFDATGNLTLPANGAIIGNNNMTLQTTEDLYLRTTGIGGVGVFSGNSQLAVTADVGIEMYSDAIGISPNAEGQVLITLTNSNTYLQVTTPVGSWTFDQTGNITLPEGGTINWYGGSNALVGGAGGSTNYATFVQSATVDDADLGDNDNYPSQGRVSYTINSNSPIIATGLIVTSGSQVDTYVEGTATTGQQILTFTTGYEYTPFTVVAFVTSNAGTVYSTPATGHSGYVCFVEGTLITMSDGSVKRIENITYNDSIRVWDFDRGCVASARPIWLKTPETAAEYNVLTFSDGSILRTIGNHHIFNRDAGRFTHTMTADTPNGTVSVNEHGEEIVLVSTEVVHEQVTYYNIWTEYHLNCYAEGVLTSNRFNNTYPVQDMRFVKDDRKLRPLSEFAGIDDKWITGLRLREQGAEHTSDYIRWYVQERLEYLDIREKVPVLD